MIGLKLISLFLVLFPTKQSVILAFLSPIKLASNTHSLITNKTAVYHQISGFVFLFPTKDPDDGADAGQLVVIELIIKTLSD